MSFRYFILFIGNVKWCLQHVFVIETGKSQQTRLDWIVKSARKEPDGLMEGDKNKSDSEIELVG